MVRTQRSGWPVLRTPKWMWIGAAVLVAGLVVAAIPHHPSNSQRVTDLKDFTKTANTDIQSCAGGIVDSMTALRAIQSGASKDVKTAVGIANGAASNCLTGNNIQLEWLAQIQVHESLASFHLQATVPELVNWAFLAEPVGKDIGKLAAARTPAAKAAAQAKLDKDRKPLDAERAKIYKAIAAANSKLHSHVPPPKLPS